jgi:tetrahydromethanopterin S-methyltransferase subunit G
MAQLEGAYEQVNHRLDSMDRHIDSLGKKIDALGNRLDAKIDALAAMIDAKIDKRFLWTVGIMFGSWLTTMLGVLGLFLKR